MLFVSILAIIISLYLLNLHYSDSGSFCDISASLSCDIVNKSAYSVFPPGWGIPVSLMGAITWLVVIIVLLMIKNNKSFNIGKTKFDKYIFSDFLFYLMILSLLFALYLVYTELFLILSICILCLVLDIIILTMLFLTWRLKAMIYGN